MKKVYVATVPTYYEIMAVARTADDAIRIASAKAVEYLRSCDAVIVGETDTPEGVADYYGVHADEVEIGTAVMVGG